MKIGVTKKRGCAFWLAGMVVLSVLISMAGFVGLLVVSVFAIPLNWLLLWLEPDMEDTKGS